MRPCHSVHRDGDVGTRRGPERRAASARARGSWAGTGLFASALTLAAGACSSAPPPVQGAPPPPVDPGPTLPAIESPARWSLRPIDEGGVTARLETSAGCLYGTEHGYRMLARALPKGGCAEHASVSGDSAEEALVGLFLRGAELVAVGETGSLFRAPSALAPFEKVERASLALHVASGGPELMLAATRAGRLLALEGQRFAPVAGLPDAARVSHVTVVGKAAIVLAMPERVFVTADGARSFDEVKLGPIGARRTALGRDGALVVTGLRGHVVWRPGSAGFAKGAGLSLEPHAELRDERSPTREPTANAALTRGGTATIVGDRYFQVSHAGDLPGHALDDGAPWVLLSGGLDGALEARPLSLAKGCASVTVGAALGKLAFVCLAHTDDGPVVRVTVSDAALTKPELAATLDLAPVPDLPRVAVSDTGSLLVTGACVRRPNVDCKPGGPVLVTQTTGTWSARAASVELEGPSGPAAFSPDGARAYFLGRSKDDKPALFVSRDAGASFTSATLEPAARAQAPDDDASAGYLEHLAGDAPSVGEDGTVGFGVATDAGLAWATADDEGRVTVRSPSEQAEHIAGYGKRAVAVSPRYDDQGGMTPHFSETVDGGVTWAPLEPPAALASDVSDLYATGLACGHAGCLVGRSATRLGWGGDAAKGASLPPRPTPPPPDYVMRTPLVCETSTSVDWQALQGARGQAPLDQHIARGKSLWSLAIEVEGGEVLVHSSDHPEGDAAPRLTKKVLLGKRAAGQRTFDALSLTQSEGFVGVRLALPAKKTPDEADVGKPMRNVEVAWEHVLEGTSGRARIADAGVVEATDLQGSRLSSFVSMTRKGVFVRPHRDVVGKAFFAEPGGKVRELYYPALPSGPPSFRAEGVLAAGPSGDEPLAVGVSTGERPGDFTAVLGKSQRGFGAKTAEPWSFTTSSLARAPSLGLVQSNLGWAHVAGREVGVVVVTSTVDGEGYATWSPLTASGSLGAPVDLPTAFDLPSAPRPCTARERRDTPRAVFDASGRAFAAFPGTRHPVQVTDSPPPGAKKGAPSASLISLATDTVVVQGTKASPCVAGWGATDRFATRQAGARRVVMSAVIAGDPKHAWLVRATVGGSTEVRPMRCKLDPSLHVGAFEDPGNARPRRP